MKIKNIPNIAKCLVGILLDILLHNYWWIKARLEMKKQAY